MPSSTISVKAQIAEAETFADSIVDSWSVTDNFGALSREFSLQAQSVGDFQVGNEVIIKAGYDNNNIQIIDGYIDETTVATSPDQKQVSVIGRDIGARELEDITITKTWKSIPPNNLPTAHKVIRDSAALAGLSVGVLEFPNYYLYASYVAIGQTILQIVSELAQPYNQFARVQYVTQVREKTLSVIKVDWANPSSGGYSLPRAQHNTQNLNQILYLEQPRLNEVDVIIIRGATWTTPKIDLGSTVRIEYNRNVTTQEVSDALRGQVTAAGDAVTGEGNPASFTVEVITEVTTIETLYGDKVLTKVETQVINNELSGRTEERYWYYEPGTVITNTDLTSISIETFVAQSLTPSENALLYMIHSKREGLADATINGINGVYFRELFRNLTEYNYDTEGNISCELNASQEFLTDENRWDIASVTYRTHSQTTGGSVRTTLTNYIFEDSRFKISSADTQQVGGTRPRLNDTASRKAVLTHQAQSPQGELDDDFQPIDPGEGFFTWTFSHPYIGQSVCDDIYTLAQEEKAFQLLGYKWENINFSGTLNPNIYVGQPVSIEVDESEFVDYIVENVTHQFSTTFAGTSGTAKRLTLNDL